MKMGSATAEMTLREYLQKYFGFDKFKGDQEAIIKNVLAGKDAFVIMPGGFGTLDEFFEAITLIQTKKIEHFPVILVDSKYWAPLVEWVKNTVLAQGKISKEDFNLIKVVDEPKQVVKEIVNYYKNGKIKK